MQHTGLSGGHTLSVYKIVMSNDDRLIAHCGREGCRVSSTIALHALVGEPVQYRAALVAHGGAGSVAVLHPGVGGPRLTHGDRQ